ncbi:MAG: DUF2852 domain-containing protein [Hyphomicrobiaceae bacterium]
MNTATLDNWVASVDQFGKGGWIALMVLGFVLFWPIGLALLAYLIWSGRMGCKGKRGRAWSANCWQGGKSYRAGSSGNTAFDEYREETLRRLEDEQKEFSDFLDSLRKAKDKAEFEQFMTDRNHRAPTPDNTSPQGT